MEQEKSIIRYVAPFFIFVIIAIFIYNLATHGWIPHPGKSTYQVQCAQCHGDKGEGIRVLIPPLESSDFAIRNFDSIPCWLRHGISHEITVNGQSFNQPMYPIKLDDIQVANVINYMNQEFFHSDKEINSAWVRERWKDCDKQAN